jgi:hypothetical protein
MRRALRRALPVAAAIATVACGTVLAIDAAPEPPAASPDGSPEGSSGTPDAGEDGAEEFDAQFEASFDAPSEATLALPRRLVFVLQTPLLPGASVNDAMMNAHVGRDAFDTQCRNEAASAGLSGSFVAFMSAHGQAQPNAIDRLPTGVAWYLPAASDGVDAAASTELVFDDRAFIESGAGPRLGIARSADGTAIVPAVNRERVWTGSSPRGFVLNADCNAWATGGNTGRWGVFGAVGGFAALSAGNETCTEPYYAICLGQ